LNDSAHIAPMKSCWKQRGVPFVKLRKRRSGKPPVRLRLRNETRTRKLRPQHRNNHRRGCGPARRLRDSERQCDIGTVANRERSAFTEAAKNQLGRGAGESEPVRESRPTTGRATPLAPVGREAGERGHGLALGQWVDRILARRSRSAWTAASSGAPTSRTDWLRRALGALSRRSRVQTGGVRRCRGAQ
jgi:hypothetical protein